MWKSGEGRGAGEDTIAPPSSSALAVSLSYSKSLPRSMDWGRRTLAMYSSICRCLAASAAASALAAAAASSAVAAAEAEGRRCCDGGERGERGDLGDLGALTCVDIGATSGTMINGGVMTAGSMVLTTVEAWRGDGLIVSAAEDVLSGLVRDDEWRFCCRLVCIAASALSVDASRLAVRVE